VPAAVVLEEMARVIDLSLLGLEQIADRRFATQHGEFARMVEVAAMRLALAPRSPP
jgi:hypothetical protein